MKLEATLPDLDNRQFYGLLGSLIVLSIVVVVSFVLLPQIKKYNAEHKTNAEHPAIPQDSAQLEVLLGERDRQIAERVRLLHGDLANLPVREIEAFVIDRLQGIAWNHDVVLEGVEPGSGENIDSFREILFRLEISGRYDDLFAWLHELRSELGFIVIKEYRMDRATQSDSDPILRVQLTVASYRKESS